MPDLETSQPIRRLPISLTNNKAGARLLCTNLVIKGARELVYLTAFGPSQEVRAFAQVLKDKNGDLDATLNGRQVSKVYSLGTNFPVRVVNLGNGHHGVLVVPEEDATRFIVGTSEPECFEIFQRHLNQEQFVHRDWHRPLFDLMPQIKPQIGNLLCYELNYDINHRVKQMLAQGQFRFPDSTADLTITRHEPEAAA